jgi:hypothetical protein
MSLPGTGNANRTAGNTFGPTLPRVQLTADPNAETWTTVLLPLDRLGAAQVPSRP